MCGITIWVLASALALSVSKINKALSVTYKLLSSRSFRCFKMDVYIRDRANRVTSLPAPILVTCDVSNDTYIWALESVLVPSATRNS